MIETIYNLTPTLLRRISSPHWWFPRREKAKYFTGRLYSCLIRGNQERAVIWLRPNVLLICHIFEPPFPLQNVTHDSQFPLKQQPDFVFPTR